MGRPKTNFGELLDFWASKYDSYPTRADVARWTNSTRPHISTSICYTDNYHDKPHGVVKVSMVDAIEKGMKEEYPHIEFDITEIWRGPAPQ